MELVYQLRSSTIENHHDHFFNKNQRARLFLTILVEFWVLEDFEFYIKRNIEQMILLHKSLSSGRVLRTAHCRTRAAPQRYHRAFSLPAVMRMVMVRMVLWYLALTMALVNPVSQWYTMAEYLGGLSNGNQQCILGNCRVFYSIVWPFLAKIGLGLAYNLVVF